MSETGQQTQEYKLKDVMRADHQSAFAKYRRLTYGDTSLGHVIFCEIVTTLFGWIPGALGLALRGVFYPLMFSEIGRKVVFGQNVTFRHHHKIRIGHRVIFDDHCVVDAKGDNNQGIAIEDNVYIGRGTIVYCKNGDIFLKKGANLSAQCQVFSSNRLTLGAGTVVGAFTYFLSGGEYDYTDRQTPFAEQSGTCTKGELVIGSNCWIGAHVTVVDAASVGDHCVVGAGAVVTAPIPAHSLAVGVPARVVKSI